MLGLVEGGEEDESSVLNEDNASEFQECVRLSTQLGHTETLLATLSFVEQPKVRAEVESIEQLL